MNSCIKDILDNKDIGDCYIMMYFYDQVVIGEYVDKNVVLPVKCDKEMLTEVHVFNRSKELRGKSFDDLKEIKDTEAYFTEAMQMIGSNSTVDHGFSTVTQNGRKMILPFEVQFSNVKDNPLKLVVHHLYNDNYEISGYRLVDIKGGNI